MVSILNDYELVYRIRENDDDAVDVMIQKYHPIIVGLAKKYYSIAKKHGADMSDLIQEGRIAVIKAISSFDVNGASIFYTYVSICIERHFITYCRNISSAKNAPLNYSIADDCLYGIGDISSDPAVSFFRVYELENFIQKKNLFEFVDSNIFELRYNGFSYKEIASLLDLPVSVIDSRLCKIRRTLQRMKTNFN